MLPRESEKDCESYAEHGATVAVKTFKKIMKPGIEILEDFKNMCDDLGLPPTNLVLPYVLVGGGFGAVAISSVPFAFFAGTLSQKLRDTKTNKKENEDVNNAKLCIERNRIG